MPVPVQPPSLPERKKIQVFDIFPFKPDDAPSGRRAARATLAPDKQVDVLLGKERAVDLRGAGWTFWISGDKARGGRR